LCDNQIMLKMLKKHALFVALVIFLISWTLFLLFIGPAEIVSFIGLENTYLAAFLIATLGGLSTLTGTSFFVAIATFAAGGASPLLLGLTGGLGIFISDSIFFLIARRGVKEFSEPSGRISRFILKYMHKLPPWAVNIFIYLYLGLSPFPSDILMIVLAFTGMSYKRLAPLLLAAGLTIATVIALFGQTIL